MNRLVIIGNGFDLAHGLPTGYCDFINDYWLDVIKTINSNEAHKFEDKLFKASIPFLEQSLSLYNNWQTIKDYEGLITFFNQYNKHFYDASSFLFQNELFRIICNQRSTANWVDIENVYYEILRSMTTNQRKYSYHHNIHQLNREFEEIKKLLKDYLIKRVEKQYEYKNLNTEVIKLFESKCFKGNDLEDFLNQISKTGEKMLNDKHQDFLKKATGYGGSRKISEIKISNTFLSFNYTSTMMCYLKFLDVGNDFLNEIHGSIIDETNPINFGFGDEMDSHYKQIEEMNNNEYLRNIKSFQYLNTPNYKRLLDLIDSEVFQVYIMGHSCGLSDRTLLNTIFEHENCCSIKIFYHQKEDGTDNYTEITQNISRHFNKKKLMREKIVNKTLCQPLPQIQLPKKENDPQS